MATYTDQQIRDKGFLYIPKQEYLQKPFQLPVAPAAPAAPVVNQGIVNTNAFTNSGSGEGGSSAPGDLMAGFNSAINARQNRLQNPNKFSEFLARYGIGGQRSVDQMMRDSTAYNMNELGPDFSQIGITSNMTGPEIQQAMAEYAGDETSIGNYPVDNPRDVRKNMPSIFSGILNMLPSSYYDKMTMPEQIYTQSKMGYTGPTIFGANTSGLQQDVFGRNIISGTGNYAKKQAKDIQKLDDLFDSEGFKNRYGDVTFEEDEDGTFSFKGVPKNIIGTRKDPNYMHKLNLIRYNYDKKGLKELKDIKNQTGFTDIMEAQNKGTTDYGITSGVSDADYTGGEGPGSLDRAIDRARERSDATTPDDFGQSEGMVDGWED